MNNYERLDRSVEQLKVNTLTSHDLEHMAERFGSSILISLIELKSTELEMI
jgi:hypothetical protein